ncbi:hypothetical protein ACJJIF_01480 [Microbulbifer sp. SSSA002]|uniref:hypothetical protein n=1 Tax=Microbulbifer sp. SSSA002 TaxID=3243376 RepID=UPI00403945C4
MKENRYLLKDRAGLEKLFYEDLFGAADEVSSVGIYGSGKHLKEMPEYELNFEPYIGLAKSCGMCSMSLNKSCETGRLYLWSVNLGGHAPRLELVPVSLSLVLDLDFMRRMHENHGHFLALKVDASANYKI